MTYLLLFLIEVGAGKAKFYLILKHLQKNGRTFLKIQNGYK
jgi:hypothetical protein